jgi:hypothetical protein
MTLLNLTTEYGDEKFWSKIISKNIDVLYCQRDFW